MYAQEELTSGGSGEFLIFDIYQFNILQILVTFVLSLA